MRFKRRILCVVALCIAVLGMLASDARAGSDCGAAITNFLAAPSEHALKLLQRSEPTTSCWLIVGSCNDNLNKLNHWVEQGNVWAARYLARHVRQLGGGNLEDSLAALGQFSEHDMEHLLLLTHQGLLSTHELSDALTMLPLSLSDDPHAQLHSLESRRSKVVKVHRGDLSKERAQALNAIDSFASEIRSKNPGVSH